MITPIVEIRHGTESQLLYGSGARFVADAEGVVTVRPADNASVALRVPRRATSLQMQGGETLTISVAPGDVIELN